MSEKLRHIMESVERYRDLSPDRLLLGRGIELSHDERRIVATQLSLRKPLEHKLPSWSSRAVYIPSQLNLEQCSSEITALLKSELFVLPSSCILDLTGGMGVDYWAFSQCARRGIYVEQEAMLVEAAKYNIHQLSGNEVEHLFVCAKALDVLEDLFLAYHPDLIYIDPARREEQTTSAKRVYAIEDCTPSLAEVHTRIRALAEKSTHYPRLVVKLSPMLDIKHTLRLYPEVRAVHIVAVRGEVKELLLFFDYSTAAPLPLGDVEIHTTDITPLGKHSFVGSYAEEERLSPHYASTVEPYIYEPNGAVMKSGLFNTLADRYELRQLHPNSHLYTSTRDINNFPGRRFALRGQHASSSSALKKLGKQLGGKAEVSTRNYPLSTDALRLKLGVKSGGIYTLMGTTLLNGSHTLLVLERL